MTYTPILTDPTEFNEPETQKCTFCHSDLNNEEITEQDIEDENSNSRNLANER